MSKHNESVEEIHDINSTVGKNRKGVNISSDLNSSQFYPIDNISITSTYGKNNQEFFKRSGAKKPEPA